MQSFANLGCISVIIVIFIIINCVKLSAEQKLFCCGLNSVSDVLQRTLWTSSVLVVYKLFGQSVYRDGVCTNE